MTLSNGSFPVDSAVIRVQWSLSREVHWPRTKMVVEHLTVAEGRMVQVIDPWKPCSAGKHGTSIGGRCSLILRTSAGEGWTNGCVEDIRASTGSVRVGMPSAQRESLVNAVGHGAGSADNKEDSVNKRGESDREGWREGSGEYCEVKSKV